MSLVKYLGVPSLLESHDEVSTCGLHKLTTSICPPAQEVLPRQNRTRQTPHHHGCSNAHHFSKYQSTCTTNTHAHTRRVLSESHIGPHDTRISCDKQKKQQQLEHRIFFIVQQQQQHEKHRLHTPTAPRRSRRNISSRMNIQ